MSQQAHSSRPFDAAKPDYTSLEFPPPPADRPYVIVNMVVSVDGKAVIEGTEQGIGSATDQRLMRELRVNADVVLDGASTMRISGASSRLGDVVLERIRADSGRSRLPIAAVWSRSGNLPLDRLFFTARDFDAVVYLGDRADPGRRAAVEATGRPVVVVREEHALADMLGHMRHELGARILLCEGGPSTTAQFFAADVVDEYFTTVGPRIVGGRDTLTPVEGDEAFTRTTVPQLELISMMANPANSELYLRYRVRR